MLREDPDFLYFGSWGENGYSHPRDGNCRAALSCARPEHARTHMRAGAHAHRRTHTQVYTRTHKRLGAYTHTHRAHILHIHVHTHTHADRAKQESHQIILVDPGKWRPERRNMNDLVRIPNHTASILEVETGGTVAILKCVFASSMAARLRDAHTIDSNRLPSRLISPPKL